MYIPTINRLINCVVGKSCAVIFFLLLIAQWSHGQNSVIKELSLDSAYILLENRYPALSDGKLLADIHQREQAKLNRMRLPNIYLKADGKFQSENIRIGESPNSPLQVDLPLYGGKAYVLAQYNILDGGVTKTWRSMKEAAFRADLQRVEVQRYALRERVNRLFLNVAILRARGKLFALSVDEIIARKSTVAAGVEEGAVLESELSKIRVKELELKAQWDNAKYSLSGVISTLSELLGVELVDSVQLRFPRFTTPGRIPPINRPEQKLFQLQEEVISANVGLINAQRKPQLSAFAQGGVGYPNPLNFLKNEVAPYGVVGIKFNWKITGWGEHKLDKAILTLHTQRLKNAKETFEFNLKTQEAGYLAELNRLQKQINRDEEIVDLQEKILKQQAVQLDEGVITATDYITQLNAALGAKQSLLIHQTELLKLQIEFWNERGGE